MGTITYECFETVELGENLYTNIGIHRRRIVSISETIEGCQDNAAGYGSMEAAARVESDMRWLQARGHEEWFDFCIDPAELDTVTAVIKWRVYQRNPETGESHYDRPRFLVGQEGWQNLRNSTRFLERVAQRRAGRLKNGDNWVWDDPSEILAALATMQAIRVNRVQTPGQGGVYFVRSDIEAEYKAA